MQNRVQQEYCKYCDERKIVRIVLCKGERDNNVGEQYIITESMVVLSRENYERGRCESSKYCLA